MIWDNVQDLFDALSAPFPNEEIMWRVGPTNDKHKKPDDLLRGQALCYVDARTVMDRLDSVCGPENWQDTYTPGVSNSIVCNIGINVGDDWIWKADGAGATDMEAEKGALSDAFKRAAVRWGVGRYLYELKAPWMVLEKRGNTAIISDAQKEALDKLHQEFSRKVQPVVGVHAYRQAYRLLISTIGKLPAESATAFGEINKQVIADLPAAMRDHVLASLNRKAVSA
jgi:hypothetical protein